MNIRRWIARRESSWQQLEQLLRQAEKQGLQSLSSDRIRQLASLYRSVSADLARAKTNRAGDTLIHELQSLTARSYALIYQGERHQDWRSILEFYRTGLPAILQQSRGYIALSTLLFMVAGAIGWWFAWTDPNFLELMVPNELIVTVRDEGELWMGSIVGVEPLASSAIAINNITVSLNAIIGGVTMYLQDIPAITPPGAFTIYLLAYNGLFIGAVAALVGQNNLAYPFWAFVLPHGSLELPAIFIAGGAGLILARSILFPGRYSRQDALKVYGLQAAKLVYGIVPLLLISGVIEGFFSPNPAVPDLLKYVVGGLLFVLLIWYCGRPVFSRLDADP
ncbi:MAG: stage II sporulation protein M [Cyanothece sp. SIO2G6]|nr:stage II sporulation protein M [Cyanothece sp. SIO2G6]